MKKIGMTAFLAVTALTAQAQSSVTLFGVVDATLAVGRGSVSNMTQLSHSGYQGNRFGFRGQEDLGGRNFASFWLEAGFAVDTGVSSFPVSTNNQASGLVTGLFNRRSTLSLSGDWGEVRVGRDYTPQFWNTTLWDPFQMNGVGQSIQGRNIGGMTNAYASNSMAYFLPRDIGGLYGQFQVYRGENPSTVANPDDGNGGGLRLGYTAGKVNVAAAYAKTRYLAGDITMANAAFSYDFTAFKLMTSISRDTVDGGARGNGLLLGVTAPVATGLVRASVSRYRLNTAGDPTGVKYAVGYVHNLSQRTQLYVTAAHVQNKNGAAYTLNGAVTAAGRNATGYDLGIKHSF